MPRHQPLRRKPPPELDDEAQEGEYEEEPYHYREKPSYIPADGPDLGPMETPDPESILAGTLEAVARLKAGEPPPAFPRKSPEAVEAAAKGESPPPKRPKTYRDPGSIPHEEIADAILHWRGFLHLAAKELGVRRKSLELYIQRYPGLQAAVEEARAAADDELMWALHQAGIRGEVGALRLWSESERGVKLGFPAKAGAGGVAREILVKLAWSGGATPTLAPGTDGGGRQPDALPSPGLRETMGENHVGGVGSDGQSPPQG